MTRALLLPAVVLLALAGCSSESEPAAAPTSAAPTTASAAPSPSGSPAADSYAMRACQKNTEAQEADANGGDVINLDTLAVVAHEAQESAVENIRLAGAMLDERVKLAEAAQGAEDEARMEAGAVAASFDLTAACAKAGVAY